MRIFLRLYTMADLKGDNGLPALILSQILLNCQQNLSSVQHLIFRLLDQAPGWVPGWAHEEYADRRFTRFLVRHPTYSIRALRGASKVSVLTGCPYYAG